MSTDRLTSATRTKLPDHGWHQIMIEFADRDSGERVGVERLGPELAAADVEGIIDGWFFIRKTPYWRLRYRPIHPAATAHLATFLDNLAAAGTIIDWWAGIYEPETTAFGGPAAMEIGHDLFCHDSRHVLASTPLEPHWRRSRTAGA